MINPTVDATTLFNGAPAPRSQHTEPHFAEVLAEYDAEAKREPAPGRSAGEGGANPAAQAAGATKAASDAQEQKDRTRTRTKQAADIAQSRESPLAAEQTASQAASAQLRTQEPGAGETPQPDSPPPEAGDRRERRAQVEPPKNQLSTEGRAPTVHEPRAAEGAAAKAGVVAASGSDGRAAPAAPAVDAKRPSEMKVQGIAGPRAVVAAGPADGAGGTGARADARAGSGPARGMAVGAMGKAMNAAQALDRLGGAKQPRLVADHEGPLTPQVARGLAAALRQGGGKVTLRLAPENLGSLTIEMRLEGKTVEATLTPGSESARELLTESVDALKTALEARGLTVERIEISPARAGEPTVNAQDATNRRGLSGDGGGNGAGAEAHAGTEDRRGERTDALRGEEEAPTGLWAASPIVTIEREAGHAGRLRVDAVA